jgi:aspartyl/asparaginyl-tRNA synthetase
MIEFEIPKNMNGLVEFVERLLDHFGYNNSTTDYPRGNYLDIAAKYETKEIGHEHEMRLYEDYGNVFLLQNFPEHTSPFWNMKRNADGTACKMDIIMSGIETIGSAERSTDVQSMTDMFYNISNGLYATTLNSRFGSSRVKKEFEEFINSEMVVRSGGGIGVTRLIRSLKMSKLMVDADTRSDTS